MCESLFRYSHSDVVACGIWSWLRFKLRLTTPATSGRQAFTYNCVVKQQSIGKFFVFFWVIAGVPVLGVKERLLRIVFYCWPRFIFRSPAALKGTRCPAACSTSVEFSGGESLEGSLKVVGSLVEFY